MISNVIEVREDGKIIDESVDFDTMVARGWAPSLVTTVRWQHDGRMIQFSDRRGVNVYVPPTKKFAVLLLVDRESMDGRRRLFVVNPDGRVRFALSNTLPLNGKVETGKFRWCEDLDEPESFQAIFEVERNGANFAIDVDAARGGIRRVEQLS